MKEACSPMYPSIMAEKQMMERREQAQQPAQQSYKPLGLDDDFVVDFDRDEKPGKCAWKVVVVPMALFLLIVHAAESGWFAQLLEIFYHDHRMSFLSSTTSCYSNHIHHEPLGDIRQSWGQYSPYFNSSSELPAERPEGCETTFVQVLARHGSRFPTTHKSQTYANLFESLVDRVPDSALKGRYQFLQNYTYDLGANDLTILGQMEMADLGVQFYTQYRDLINDNDISRPFVRASGSNRVINSAVIFSQALTQSRLDDSSPNPDGFHIPVLVISEDAAQNNTLDHGLCRNMELDPYHHIASHAMKTFADRFVLPIADRLNADLKLAGDDKLSLAETGYLMDTCAFESVALLHPFPPSRRTADGTGISPVCGIFSDNDFRVYDYRASLGKYYGFSHGNPLAPSSGVGFVNELIARMTDQPVNDHTSSNTTLDRDQRTFPVGKQSDGRYARLFADFSHDNTIASIHAAFGLYENVPHLPVDRVLERGKPGGWSAAGTVPFGARTVFEKLQCEGEEEELVRIIVNGRVTRLNSCDADDLGRCTLSKFVDSLHWARKGGDWDKCFD